MITRRVASLVGPAATRQLRLASLCLAALAAMAGGCAAQAPDGVIGQCQSELSLPPAVTTDILFVIDDSGSMREEQDKVIAQLDGFVAALASGPVKNDFQVGVVTTSITECTQGCSGGAPVLATFDAESGRLRRGRLSPAGAKVLGSSDPGAPGAAWRDQVKQLIDQGTSGSGQEMGLEAARRAVSEPLISTPQDATPPGNRGFLRPGSRLLVVIVSDEDDCSVPTPDALPIEGVCGPACQRDSDCGGEGNYCVLDGSGASARRCTHNACETPDGRARLVAVDEFVSFFKTLDDQTGNGRAREVFLAVIGAVDADGNPSRCRSASDEAYGVARRYRQAVDAMGENGLIASICSADYGRALERVAALVSAPQTLELTDAPIDPLLMQIVIERDGGTVTCRDGAGFDFTPAQGGARARATLTGECRLRFGDKLAVKLACVG